MVAALAPRPGETILELAGGAGVSGFAAAALLQGEGRLIMTDFAENMVEAQRRRGAELGLDNVEYRVMDAEHMDLDDDSVDGVLCRWGYMLMADPAAALRETRRVLRDGGTLAFAVWQTPDRNPWAAIPGMTLVQRGHMPPPEPGAPGMFALGDRDGLMEVVTGAGVAGRRGARGVRARLDPCRRACSGTHRPRRGAGRGGPARGRGPARRAATGCPRGRVRRHAGGPAARPRRTRPDRPVRASGG